MLKTSLEVRPGCLVFHHLDAEVFPSCPVDVLILP